MLKAFSLKLEPTKVFLLLLFTKYCNEKVLEAQVNKNKLKVYTVD